MLNSNDDDSEESDFLSIAGEDVDAHLNHYRVPKLLNYGPFNGTNNPPKHRGNREQVKFSNEGKIMSLTELAAQKVACHLPFGLVEHFTPPVPEPMQCRIAYWSFPQDEEDVKLYTCLANGNADVFYRAEEFVCQNAVRDMLQVGFHLSANVQFLSETEELEFFRVAITFDRRRITSCSCSCMTATFWCQHVVAVCLHRIRKPHEVKLRSPVSESLQRLEKNQLQKFAQYLINELPQQILPAAQKLLDELLSGDEAIINKNPGAPDPTAGATIHEQTSWCLDYTHLSMDIHRILIKQCTAQPTVCSDIQSLHVTAPPPTTEYSQLLRPIRGREPEGIWNLISIVGEMMKRRDPNLFPLLEIMTEEIMKFDKIITWWFETKVSLHSGSTIHVANQTNKQNSQSTSQYSCSNFCDEIVHLWCLAALNPSASPSERQRLYKKFFAWHLAILRRHSSLNEGAMNNSVKSGKRNCLELFPGFKMAMEACHIAWDDWDDKKGRLITEKADRDNDKAATVTATKQVKRRKRRAKYLKNAGTTTTTTATEPAKTTSEPEVSTNTLGNDENTEKANLTSQVHKIDAESGDNLENQEASCSSDAKQSDSNVACDLQTPQRRIILGNVTSNREQDCQAGQQQQQAVPAVIPNENDNNEDHEEQIDDNNGNEELIEQDEAAAAAAGGAQNDLEPELQVYFMDGQADSPQRAQKAETLEELIKVNVKRLADPLETLYAKMEGLHAHGYLDESRRLAQKVANEILSQVNYPSLKQLYALPRRRKKKGTLDNQMSIVTSETLNKIHFLCCVLMDYPEDYGLVFKLIMFGVELRRSPAATKPLEVKLISQKQELIMLLKYIALSDEELAILREKADNMRKEADGGGGGVEEPDHQEHQVEQQQQHQQPPQQPDALTALILGNYIFEALVLPRSNKQPADTSLGFQAALAALGTKIGIPETDHPLLCEGIRRQRGELALALISHYKDDQERLDQIMKQLLDKDVVTDSKPHLVGDSTSSKSPSAKKNLINNVDPNQLPSEASAHFMFELAKTVFDKAGGSSTTAHLFRPQLVAQNGGRGIHRKLHMCTLRIALYALGLQNRTSPNWMQRTYNGRASFIHEQALEIGLPAIKYLSENWEGYLTPVEAACIADKAGSSFDPEVKKIAAEMAKSCLKYANYLDYTAVCRILAQCKEQTIEMTEKACKEIEQTAENDNVCADILFATARAWHGIYLRLMMDEQRHCPNNVDNLYQLNHLHQFSQPPEQEAAAAAAAANVAPEWLAISGQQQQQYFEKLQNNDPLYPINWEVYVSGSLIPTHEVPNYKNIEYVQAAFRVGLRALDSLKLTSHMGSKHNPKKLDEIYWFFGISKSLGREYLFKFSRSIIKNITDPNILQMIIMGIIRFFEIIKLPEDHVDRDHILMPIYDQCLDRCLRQTRDLMKHISLDHKSCIDNILEVIKNLTVVTRTPTTIQYYWEILKFVEHKLEKRQNRKSRIFININERREWICQFFMRTHPSLWCCNDCFAARGANEKLRLKTLYQNS